MSVLLIAEHNNKELRPFTLNAVTAASQIDNDVHAVIIGQNSGEAAKALSELPLIKKVIQVYQVLNHKCQMVFFGNLMRELYEKDLPFLR